MRSYERPPSIRRLGIALAIGCGVVVAALSLAGPGASVIGVCYRFLEFYSGVFSLVALSLTVMGGLAATDRLLLQVRHRVLLQAVHRATAFAAVGFLGCHALTKLAERHARLIDLVVPFAASHHTVVIGLGTVAGHGLVLAACTGIARGRFAAVPKVWVWRAVHSIAYLAWPAAMIHGLTAGRRPATWVVVGYAACAIVVLLALFVRVIVNWKGGPVAARTQTAARWSGAAIAAVAAARWSDAHVTTAWQPVRARHAADAMREIAVPTRSVGVAYELPWQRDLDGAAEVSGHGVFEAVSDEAGAYGAVSDEAGAYGAVSDEAGAYGAVGYEAVGYEAGDDARTRPFESVSDDEFWAYLRGGDRL